MKSQNQLNANYMTGLFALMACGPACWEAKDDICRCSCGGKNHGIHRHGSSHIPLKRQKVYEGFIWELEAVSEMQDMGSGLVCPISLGDRAQALNEAAGITFYYAHTARKHYGEFPVAITRTATDGEIARWPELAAWRGKVSFIYGKPELLWIRRDDITKAVIQQMKAA